MKKAMMLAAAALTTLSVSAEASASGVLGYTGTLIDLSYGEIFADRLGLLGTVGAVFPLGRSIDFNRTCSYVMEWESPWNPNLVNLCVLEEVRTLVNPSCVVNAAVGSGTPTTVFAGNYCTGPYALAMGCAGFDLLGIPVAADIIATHIDGVLVGTVMLDHFVPLPITIA